jgi:twitching motility two-component system response regulator PilH
MSVTKVLCVDDAAADLTNIQKIVSSANVQVLSATGGKEALARARADKPDLIFLDIVMPDMDGFAVMRELQKDPATKDIPVVFVSSKSQKADQLWAKMQGGKGFVAKPITPDAVLTEVKKF